MDEFLFASLESIPGLFKGKDQDDLRVVLTLQPGGKRYLYGGESGKPTESHGRIFFRQDPPAYVQALQHDIDNNLGDWLEDIEKYPDIFPFIGKT